MGTNKRIKIQIERKGLIDLFEDINIPITKVLSDIRDLSKRSGGYSTSIEVPGSKNNLQLFGHLYDINISNSTFSLKKKYKCVVIKDDIEIFYGYIRMEGINKYEGPDGETLITFNISLHDDVSNFYMKIKDKYINPLDNIDITNNIFWDDLVISKYNYNNIISTFENTIEDKFKFFLPFQSRGYYQTTDFKPAVYVYEYVNRIISSAGYTWNGSKDGTGNFIDKSNWDNLNYHTNFDKLVIPYAGSSDITKTLDEHNVFLGYDNIKPGFTCDFSYNTGSTINTLSITGGTSLNVEDIVEIQISGNTIGYLEVHTTGSTTYNVKVTNKNGILNQNQYTINPLTSNGQLIVYNPSKFFLNQTSTNYFDSYCKLQYNLKTNSYYDSFSSTIINDVYYHKTSYNQLFSGGIPISGTTLFLNSSGTNDILYKQNQFVATTNGTINVNVVEFINWYMYAEKKCWFAYNVGDGTDKINFNFILNVYKNGTLMSNFSDFIVDDTIWKPTTGITSTSIVLEKGVNTIFDNKRISFNINLPVVKGDIFKFEINFQRQITGEESLGGQINGYFRAVDSIYVPPNYFVGLTNVYDVAQPIFDGKNQTINIKYTGIVQEDDENLSLKYFIPKKIKQSDLLLGLCRTLNLFIDYDEQNKTLLILPRDQYYELGEQIDWTEKLDISNKNSFQFYPDLKYKNYIYTYKLDSDDYSKAYNENVKEIYGQVNIKFENDLLDGTTTIDNLFFSTPIARAGGNSNIYDGDCSNPTTNSGSLQISSNKGNLISIIDYSKTTNIKLLYDCGLQSDSKSVPFVFRIKTSETLPTGNTYTFTCNIPADTTTSSPAYNVGWLKYTNKDSRGYYQYPHIGHFFNGPMQPNDDLNFAICDYYFYDDINIFTQNNLFYKHWLRTIRQQRDCKLLKARIHLSPAEVNSIRFYNKFYVFDTWWVLNKFEYNEDGSDLYNVELINLI